MIAEFNAAAVACELRSVHAMEASSILQTERVWQLVDSDWLCIVLAAATPTSFIKHCLQLIGGSVRQSKSTHLTELLLWISYHRRSLKCLSASHNVRTVELNLVGCVLTKYSHISRLVIFFNLSNPTFDLIAPRALYIKKQPTANVNRCKI